MKKHIIRGFGVTAFVFLAMWGLKGLTQFEALEAFDPISQALAEFELTDIVFSKLRPDPVPDQRLVLVNLGEASRMEIAQYISVISSHKPKVIGIDSFFNCEGGLYNTKDCPQLLDTLGNLMLSNSIQEAGNVVMVARLLQSKKLFAEKPSEMVFDSIEQSDPMFSDYAHNAYANLPTGDEENNNAAAYQEDVKICKSIIPQMMVNGKRHLAFSVQMAMMYDSVKTQRFLDRGNFEEIINFRGNINITDVRIAAHRAAMEDVSGFNAICFAMDGSDLLEENTYDPKIFENSIVIVGFLGKYLGHAAWEDKFFSPLNLKVAGRANPDMYGPVIHTNVVAMILNEDYVNKIPVSTQVIIAVVMCFLNVLLFWWIDNRFPAWFDGLSVILQLIQIFLAFGVVVWAFSEFSLKLELTLTVGALALVGPCFDIAKSVENVLEKALTNRQKPVLTTQNQEIS